MNNIKQKPMMSISLKKDYETGKLLEVGTSIILNNNIISTTLFKVKENCKYDNNKYDNVISYGKIVYISMKKLKEMFKFFSKQYTFLGHDKSYTKKVFRLLSKLSLHDKNFIDIRRLYSIINGNISTLLSLDDIVQNKGYIIGNNELKNSSNRSYYAAHLYINYRKDM